METDRTIEEIVVELEALYEEHKELLTPEDVSAVLDVIRRLKNLEE